MSAPAQVEAPTPGDGKVPFGLKSRAAFHVMSRSNWLITLLAIVIALLIGAIFIWMSGSSIIESYWRLFRGAIFDPNQATFERQIKPITETLKNAAPLILAGLGLGLGFRAGLFNIGGQGQIILGAIGASWAGFAFNLPIVIHLVVAVLVAFVFGGIWGGIAGLLKAKTGANEVILTIMLNSIAGALIVYILRTDLFQVEGSAELKSKTIMDNAALPQLLPGNFSLHAGFILAIIATVFVWWLLERSTFGFELRAVGANPNAARTAGMSTGRITTLTMAISAGLCGLAGANQVLGTFGYMTQGVAETFGFDAITVALLGRNRPGGIFLAGILFGAFKAGAPVMQGAGVPVDMILILQAVIVLLIAAPPLVRFVFRLPKPDEMTYREYITMNQEVAR